MILRIESIFCISISLSDFTVSKLVVYLTDNIAGICIQLIWSEIIPFLYRIELISILTSWNSYFKDESETTYSADGNSMCRGSRGQSGGAWWRRAL
jgi:hypothetical protein